MSTKKKESEEQGSVCPKFGILSEISETMLPTNGDVIKYYLYVRYEKKSINNQAPAAVEVPQEISNKIELLWKNALVPTISIKRVSEKIRLLHDAYRNILKPFKDRKNSETFQRKLNKFKVKAENTLFDIARCKCTDFNNCRCDKSNKVPIH